MIKLNLATVPGIQGKESAKAPIYEYQVEVEEKLPTAEEGVTGATPKPKQKIDADLFKLAEQNLDLIEQAEKEEFVPKHKPKPPKKEKEEGPTIKIKRRIPLLRLFYLLLAIIVIGGGFWVYKSKFYKKVGIKVPTKSEVKKVTEKVQEKVTEQLPDVVDKAKGIGQSVVTSSQEAVKQVAIANEISDQNITQILNGKNVLDIGLKLLQSFPQNARLQYLRVKSNKVSFILYLPTRNEGLTLKNSLINNSRFLSPDVFYIERDKSNLNAPYQVMAIIKYRDTILRSIKGFVFKIDNELAQIIGNYGQNSNVSLTPFKVFKEQNYLPRKAQFSGKGSARNCISFLKKIKDMNMNIGIESVYIYDNSNRKLESTILAFTIDTNIFPRKP